MDKQTNKHGGGEGGLKNINNDIVQSHKHKKNSSHYGMSKKLIFLVLKTFTGLRAV